MYKHYFFETVNYEVHIAVLLDATSRKDAWDQLLKTHIIPRKNWKLRKISECHCNE